MDEIEAIEAIVVCRRIYIEAPFFASIWHGSRIKEMETRGSAQPQTFQITTITCPRERYLINNLWYVLGPSKSDSAPVRDDLAYEPASLRIWQS